MSSLGEAKTWDMPDLKVIVFAFKNAKKLAKVFLYSSLSMQISFQFDEFLEIRDFINFLVFSGVYLPLLWETSFCSRSPIALGYTRGHFCGLVPPEPVEGGPVNCAQMTSGATACSMDPLEDEVKATFLPLMTADRKSLLPIHFLSQSEAGNEEVILRQWLDTCLTENGLVVAQQRIIKPPLLVAQMTEEWLNHYRKIS